ncbi:MAG TPA: hypothetical protein VK828_09800 [Terriglobales bacterium]|nr:hypothetical protein [Terriglobales bacterium]
MMKRYVMTICVAVLAVSAGLAQQKKAAPSSKPADQGPSLAVTMKFIQGNASAGKLSYTTFVSDSTQQGVEWKDNINVEMSNLVADAKTCGISFHWRAEVNGKVSDDSDYNLNLAEVKDIVVLPQDQNQQKVDARNGHPEWTLRVEPNLFTLVARRPKGLENAFLFSEEEMAGRIAKAMVHAVELCGGGNKDPF